jgi:hypothetical protein
MRSILGQEKNIAGLEHCDILLVILEIMELELTFELVKDFVARIDVKILAAIGSARHERDEVRIAPDHSALAPVGAVLIDPFLQIESL